MKEKAKPSPWEVEGGRIGALVAEKNAAYGDAFGRAGEIVRILYPKGIPAEKFDDALAIVRVIDKLFRIATDRDAFGEDPWRDVAGYALLSVVRRADAIESVVPKLREEMAKAIAHDVDCAMIDEIAKRGPIKMPTKRRKK